MRKFKSISGTQKILSSMEAFLNLFKVGRYKKPADEYRRKLKEASAVFNKIVTSQESCT